MGALAKNISSYDLIQEQLCEVTEKAVEEAVEEQRDANSAYQTLFNGAGCLENDACDLVATKDLSGSYVIPASLLSIFLLLSRLFVRL